MACVKPGMALREAGESYVTGEHPMEPADMSHTLWRRTLGERVAAAYAADPNCAAVAIAGSVARGWADRHSDVEVDVYWREPPADADRIAAIERAGSRVDITWSCPPDHAKFAALYAATGGSLSQLWPYEQGEWSEHFYVPPSNQGVNVGVSAFLVSTIDGYLDDVLDRTLVDDERQMRLAAMQRKILRILLALNRIYLPDPRFKWADRLIAQMQIVPPNLAERLPAIFTFAPSSAVQQTDALFYETLTLVRAHAPAVLAPALDVDFAAAWFRRRRPIRDAAPDILTG
jgi:predicted nucleotidyltransferase